MLSESSTTLSELWASTDFCVLCLYVCLLQCSMEQRKKLANWRDNWQLIRTVWSLYRAKSIRKQQQQTGGVTQRATFSGTVRGSPSNNRT